MVNAINHNGLSTAGQNTDTGFSSETGGVSQGATTTPSVFGPGGLPSAQGSDQVALCLAVPEDTPDSPGDTLLATGTPASPSELAEQVTILMEEGATTQEELTTLLDGLSPQERIALIQAFCQIPGNQGGGQASSFTTFWERLQMVYGDASHNIWLNHVINGMPGGRSNSFQMEVLHDFFMTQENWTPGMFTAVQNYLNNLSPQDQAAFNANYNALHTQDNTHNFMERWTQLATGVINTDITNNAVEGLNDHLDLMNPTQRQAVIAAIVDGLGADAVQDIRETIANERGIQADSNQMSNYDIFYRHLVNTLGSPAHNTWLNHAVVGIPHPGGGNFQAHVLYQWLVQDRHYFEQHPQHIGDYILVQGQREAIRNFMNHLGVQNLEQMDAVETPQTAPFFSFCNNEWTDTFRNHLPAVGQLPGYLAQAQVFQDTNHEALPYQAPPPPPEPESEPEPDPEPDPAPQPQPTTSYTPSPSPPPLYSLDMIGGSSLRPIQP